MLRPARLSVRPAHARHGFTLTEISIVLVVVSLLVGSIMVGTSLIRSARLRAVMQDKTTYENAVLAFRERYSALPGDMINATDIWGSMVTPVNYTTCANLLTPSTDKKTCNGNGNDSIFDIGTNPGYGHEQYRMWQHLANAGLIEGIYSGVKDCNSDDPKDICATPGKNTPASTIAGGTYFLADRGRAPVSDKSYNLLWTTTIDKHLMFFGGTVAASLGAAGSNPIQPVLTPNEAWGIDVKFDDGLPGQGSMRVVPPITVVQSPFNEPTQNCATTNVASTAKYNRSLDSLQCTLFFYMPF